MIFFNEKNVEFVRPCFLYNQQREKEDGRFLGI